MKLPTFFEGVAVAAVTSLTGSILFTVLASVFSGSILMRLIVAILGLAYILYLLSRSRERIGRTTVMAVWILVTAVTWFMTPSLLMYTLVHVGLIWLVRSLYFYSSALSSLGDLGLNVLSLAAAVWAAIHSGSVFLSIWCFFLMQALFVYIPACQRTKSDEGLVNQNNDDRFQRAYHGAESALHKLTSIKH
jgi:hypothetical protein